MYLKVGKFGNNLHKLFSFPPSKERKSFPISTVASRAQSGEDFRSFFGGNENKAHNLLLRFSDLYEMVIQKAK